MNPYRAFARHAYYHWLYTWHMLWLRHPVDPDQEYLHDGETSPNTLIRKIQAQTKRLKKLEDDLDSGNERP